jgi:hypothetical protein
MASRFFADPDSVLGTLARLFAADGAAREVAILTYSTPEIVESHYDNWNGGRYFYNLILHVPINLYPQIEASKKEISASVKEKIQVFLQGNDHEVLSEIAIVPAVVDDPQWREKAAAWLSGSKISNQGRVRSDNVAPLTQDGLLFRSRPEIHIYKALKATGVSFAPLPVFIRGGESYSRIEPDFVLIYKGITMVLEVDGDTVHTETPAEAQARTRTLQHEGVHVERIAASECDTPQKAKDVAEKVMNAFQKLKDAK